MFLGMALVLVAGVVCCGSQILSQVVEMSTCSIGLSRKGFIVLSLCLEMETRRDYYLYIIQVYGFQEDIFIPVEPVSSL